LPKVYLTAESKFCDPSMNPRQALNPQLELVITDHIKSDLNLYERILQYQPISLDELGASLKNKGIKTNNTILATFLDQQSISFSRKKKRRIQEIEGEKKVRARTRSGRVNTSERAFFSLFLTLNDNQ